jgi:hypothetical protein
VRCQKCGNKVHDRALLCARCRTSLLASLASLRRSWQITESPRTLSQGFSEGGRSSERPLPGGSEWLNFRQGAEMSRFLTSWVEVIRSSEALVPPRSRSIPALLDWIALHLDAALEHESVTFFAEELGAFVEQGRRLDGSTEPRGMRVPCLTDECTAFLHIRAAELTAAATCKDCGVTRDVAQVIALAMLLEVWVPPSVAAIAAGVTERTLRTWAKDGRVIRKGSDYWLPSIRLGFLT